MIPELRKLSIGILVLFGALFVSTTIIQIFQADSLRVDARNVRTLYDSYSTERGSIVVGSTVIAESIPSDDIYEYQRVYHGGGLYAPVTGYYSVNQGTAGLEYAMNDQLSGSSNSQFLDQVLALVSGRDPKGASVKLTLNASVQQAARDAFGSLEGAAVAFEPSTGRILGLVSTPSYDPNDLATHDASSAAGAFEQLTTSKEQPLSNRAIAGTLYHPGSVFKLVVAAAALDSGEYNEESTFENPATLTLPQSDSTVSNSNGQTCGYGDRVTIATALRLSCNIPFAELGSALGQDRIRSYAEAFGFGAKIEIPMTSTPSVYPTDMDEAQVMLSSFGQFDVQVSPLQMAMVAAAIANDGVLMSPTVVESVLAPDLSPVTSFTPVQYSTPITPGTANLLTAMMVDDVANGVANNAAIPGIEVAGKTGTAENGKKQPYTLWFVGFAPADNPRVAVAVVVENGGGVGQSGSGNSIAAPIARAIMKAVLAQ